MGRQIEARPRARLAINRLTIARIFSLIGLVALLVALIMLLSTHELSTAVLFSAVIGIGGISLWTTLAPGDLRTLLSGRQARYGSNSLFAIVLVIGIVSIIYTLIAGTGIAADMTSVGFYSIKSYIQPIINSISAPIVITAFYSTSRLNDQSADTPILRMFTDAAPNKIKVVVLDPNANPAIAQRFGQTNSFGVYISHADDQGQPDLQNTVKMNCPAEQVDITQCYANERWIAQAIAQLEARNKYRILFTIGHGELNTDEASKGDAYLIRTELGDVGIITGVIDLRNQNIPDSTSALVMLGPQADLRQDEVDRIASYMSNGGKLVVMANPPFQGAIHFMVGADSPMSKYLWANWGLRAQSDIVYDPQTAVGDYYRISVAGAAKNNPITKKDANTLLQPLFTIAQSWELAPQPPANVTINALFSSSNKSYGKTNVAQVAKIAHPEQLPQEQGDLGGPLILAASAENSATKARLVVVGDANWVVNEVIESFDGHDLWRNIIDYLTNYLTQITVQPTIAQNPLITTTSTLNMALWVTLVIMPGLVLALGAFVMWNRLRR